MAVNNKRECFITEIEEIIKSTSLSQDALDYFELLKNEGGPAGQKFTENGKLILSWLKENYNNYNNMLKAKDIAEAISISSRTVSGGMRKLVSDGYVDKIGTSPVVYSITQKGVEVDISAE